MVMMTMVMVTMVTMMTTVATDPTADEANFAFQRQVPKSQISSPKYLSP